MVFSCAPNFRAKAAAKRQALKQKLAGVGAYHGVSLRLLLVDKQVDSQGVLPKAALGTVHVVEYDAHSTTLAELVGMIREAHRQNGAPFLSMAIAQHGADAEGQWEWTTDLAVNLKSVHGALDQLAPVVEVLAAALSKTRAGKAHIDLLACNLATTCKGLVPALEKMYGIDFRASTDETGNDLSGGDWKMETDNDYDVAADYLDAAKLKQYSETMAKGGAAAAVRMPGKCHLYDRFDGDYATPAQKAEMRRYVTAEYCDENLDFVDRVHAFKAPGPVDAAAAAAIKAEFIGSNAPQEINIDAAMARAIKALAPAAHSKEMFDAACVEAKKLLADGFASFKTREAGKKGRK